MSEPTATRERVLRERARALARAVQTREGVKEGFEVALVAVGKERFGVPVVGLREIVPLPKITRLPTLPPHFLGLTQVRGEVVSVVDLGRWFGIESGGDIEYLVLLDGAQGPVGLTVEEVLGFRRVLAEELEAVEADQHRRRPVSALTRDLVAVLDLEALSKSQELIVR